PVVDGPLARDAVIAALDEARRDLSRETAGMRDAQGMISVRLTVDPSGASGAPEVLFNNIVSSRGDAGSAAAAAEAVLARLSSLRLGPIAAPARLTIPVLVPVATIAPIAVEHAHALPIAEAHRRVESLLAGVEARALLAGRWHADEHFAVACP